MPAGDSGKHLFSVNWIAITSSRCNTPGLLETSLREERGPVDVLEIDRAGNERASSSSRLWVTIMGRIWTCVDEKVVHRPNGSELSGLAFRIQRGGVRCSDLLGSAYSLARISSTDSR